MQFDADYLLLKGWKFSHLLTFFLQAFNIMEMREGWNAKSTIKNTPSFLKPDSNRVWESGNVFIFLCTIPLKAIFSQLNIMWWYIIHMILSRQDIRKNLKMDLELCEPQLKYWLESCLWSSISSTTCQYYECPVAITALRNEQYRLILPLLLRSAGLQSSNSFY